MRIAIFGAIYVNVNIRLTKPFDEFGNNEGLAKTSYTSEALKLAKSLAETEENEIYFLTSIGNETASPYIKKDIESANINTTYVTRNSDGLGFNIEFADDNIIRPICTSVNLDPVVEKISVSQESFFKDLSMLVLTHYDEKIVELCRKHKVDTVLLTNEDESAELEEELEGSSFKSCITLKYYNDFVREVSK